MTTINDLGDLGHRRFGASPVRTPGMERDHPLRAGTWGRAREAAAAVGRAVAPAGITGHSVLPAVISANIDNDRETLAAQHDVTLMVLSEN